MSDQISHPTLGQFFAVPSIQPHVQRRWFRGPCVTTWAYLAVGAYQYQNGALIGRAMTGKRLQLEMLLGNPAQPGVLLSILHGWVNERLQSYRDTPPSFFALFSETGPHRVGLNLNPSHPDLTDHFKRKLPLRQIEGPLEMAFNEGLGFGLEYPALTATIFRSQHEEVRKAWNKARQAGMSLSETSLTVTIEEQERACIEMLTGYVVTYRPELGKPLGLTTH